MQEETYDDAAARYAARPESLMSLRSCIKCRLVKTLDQFQDSFCDNCWSFWDGNESGELPSAYKKGRALDMALQNTTADFEGLTSMMRPNDSWVAKWLRLSACVLSSHPKLFYFMLMPRAHFWCSSSYKNNISYVHGSASVLIHTHTHTHTHSHF